MLAGESGGSTFDLPEEVLQVLPSDPFDQLDVARKITSIALSTRVSSVESESSALRAQLAQKDELIAQLQAQIESLDASLSDTADKLARADLEKVSLLKDNASLSNTVRKLHRDVSKASQSGKVLIFLCQVNKSHYTYLINVLLMDAGTLALLEVFRRTLMQSLQEDDESSSGGTQIIAKPTPTEDDASWLSRTSSMRSHFEIGNSFAEDRETDASKPGIPGISHGLLLVSQTNTPRVTPPGSPPSLSASVSPTRTSKPGSPRRHSMSFSTSRGMFDDRSSIFSSVPSSHHSSISTSDTGSHSG
ncbi:hypothetical protein SLEP1_g46906 [Rubroshorea leprosula]|nr:hypothetical protein SLEP1_g46906 [Rubroshorea leprosula]